MENRLIIIDTDAVIDFFLDLSPSADVVSKLISQEEAALTSISVFELYSGIEGKRRLGQIEKFIRDLTILPLDVIEAVMAGRIYTQLKLKGQLIGTYDIFIAGICLINNFPIYTKNVAHFSKIEGIQILSPQEILRD